MSTEKKDFMPILGVKKEKYEINRKGNIRTMLNKGVIVPERNKISVRLFNDKGERKTYIISALVKAAFAGEPAVESKEIKKDEATLIVENVKPADVKVTKTKVVITKVKKKVAPKKKTAKKKPAKKKVSKKAKKKGPQKKYTGPKRAPRGKSIAWDPKEVEKWNKDPKVIKIKKEDFGYAHSVRALFALGCKDPKIISLVLNNPTQLVDTRRALKTNLA